MSRVHHLRDLLPPGVSVREDMLDLAVTGLALDSRKVEPGDVFAALPGVRTHGGAYVSMAEDRGAVAILGTPDTATRKPLIAADDPREALAAMAARFYPGQPDTIAAVTGTNGKSSTVEFLRQIWASAGRKAAALGTLGVTLEGGRTDVGYTTPDAIRLHRSLDDIAARGVTHLAMEASSHGLKQRRMDAVRLSLAGFSNLSQDHLDYHPDFEDYFASKMRLFDTLLPKGSPAVVDVDTEWGVKVADLCRSAGHRVMTVGWGGRDLQLKEITPHPASQDIRLSWKGAEHRVTLPLIGEFQTANALLAAGLAIHSGVDPDEAFSALSRLTGVPGRLELAATTRQGSPILVDYAHTPDGLDKLLRAARPHTRGRIVLVFGAGGDRDPSKREKMGAVAARLADESIVTDDNPRSENPAKIREAILKGCPEASEIADRAEAIEAAVMMLEEGDTLLIAGKGHETGQIVGDRVIPFDDREAARRALKQREKAR